MQDGAHMHNIDNEQELGTKRIALSCHDSHAKHMIIFLLMCKMVI